MKIVFSNLVMFASLSAQAQFADQKIPFLKCTGGTGRGFTTLVLTSGGFVGGSNARIKSADFDSGELFIEQFTGGIEIPENRTYVDRATQGKVFTFTYDFININGFNHLKFVDRSGKSVNFPELHCAGVR